MTSANSLYKSGFSAAFKKNLKQRSAGAVVLFIFNMLISFAISVILVLNYRTEPKSITVDATYEASFIAGITALTSMVYSFFASFRYFKEIYKKRNCDFYFSAPIKREEYFNANFLFGIIVNFAAVIIPAVLFYVFTKFQVLSKADFSISLKTFIASLVVILLASFAMLSAFIMCAVISGKRIHYIILCLICASFAPAAFAGVANNINTVWGIMIDPVNFEALSPVGNLLKIMCKLSDGSEISLKCFAALSVIMLVEFFGMYAAGLYIFKKRKAEIAEVAITGKTVPFIMLAVLVLSVFMNALISSSIAVSLIAGTITAVVVTLIFTLIFYRKPFIKQSIVTLAAVGILSICFIICVNTSAFDEYISYVPDASEVESIELSEGNDYSYYSSTERILGISYLGSYYGSEGASLNFKSEDSINSVIEMHKKIVDKETIKASNYNLLDGYDSYGSYDCKIVYTLKNGKKVKRVYSVNSESIYAEYVKVMKTEETFSQALPYSLNKEDILFATTSGNDGEAEYYSDEVYLPSENLIPADMDYNKLLDCIKADKLNNNNQDFLNSFYYSYGMNYYPASYYYNEPYAYVSVYVWGEGVSDEEKAEFSGMTPAQLKKYYDDLTKRNFSTDEYEKAPFEEYYIEILAEDKNTLEYLSSVNAQ